MKKAQIEIRAVAKIQYPIKSRDCLCNSFATAVFPAGELRTREAAEREAFGRAAQSGDADERNASQRC